MYKTGIITHFYKSKNYGGVLQAYALTQQLKKSGVFSEQLRYPFDYARPFTKKKRKISKYFNICKYYNFFSRKVKKITIDKMYVSKIRLREASFEDRFFCKLPQSEAIYNPENIISSAKVYDAFITGSDQVWNFDWFDPNYFLEFVPNDKIKIAYSVSMGHNELTEEQKVYLKRVLASFDAVSVREKEMVKLLQPLTEKKVEWVLDPTLLLSQNDWDKICSDRLIDEKYLFCYFLGNNRRIRKLAKQYARLHNLKIVNLPHVSGVNTADFGFGDYKLYDIAPNDFISLIKHSDCVFTDSFHACVFSEVYNKNIYVFNRAESKSMSTRIYSFCELFNCIDHFCDANNKMNINYIEGLKEVDFSKNTSFLDEMREKSIHFLENYLKESKNKCLEQEMP